MMNNIIKILKAKNTDCVEKIVEIHISAFPNFFLTTLGKGFLKHLYSGFIKYDESNVYLAEDEEICGFLAYTENLSGFYRYLIKKSLFSFAWYSLLAFLKRPTLILRLLRALLKPGESKRREKYVELSSIGVIKGMENKHIGRALIDCLKMEFDASKFAYIKLETDAENNDRVNKFYLSNGFIKADTYTTSEGRKMNEYRWTGRE